MSTVSIKSKNIITPQGLLDGFVHISGSVISGVDSNYIPSDTEYDFGSLYVSPGFIDTHTHGAGGHSFLDSSADEVISGCDFHLKHGMTSILPTVSAAPFDVMKRSVIAIADAAKSGKAKSNILGAHLEGPYLSAAQCGAQWPDFITPPNKADYEPLVKVYGKYIKRWSYAPENDKDGNFCRFIKANGIIASAGHTDAEYCDMLTAVKNGCNLITHLYSCTSTVTRNMGFRSLGVIESAYLLDELNVELIADGRHLPKELVQMIIKIKGFDKTILTTDSLDIAGTDIKEGTMGKTEFIVEDGVCKLKDRSAFAGSIATADALLRFTVKDCDFDICEAVKMLTANPAALLGVKKGLLSKGYDADIVAFDDDINVKNVFVGGKLTV